MPRKAEQSAELVEFLKQQDIAPDIAELAVAANSPQIALAIADTDAGVYPSDPDAIADFLQVNRDMETKALRDYLKLARSVGPKLSELRSRYTSYQERTTRLFSAMVGTMDGDGTA
jgi:CRP-like cAMP-binding protein